MSYRCFSTIRSPWRMGMTVTCQKRADHDGGHRFDCYPLPGQHEYVEWTGEDAKLTAREQGRAARIAERRAPKPKGL